MVKPAERSAVIAHRLPFVDELGVNMADEEINREDVLKAVAEFDEIGREAFLEKYGFHEATKHYLVVNGRRYDSKAILGAANRYAFPDGNRFTDNRFSGGEETI